MTLTLDRDANVLLIGVQREEKANAWNPTVITAVAQALGQLRDDPSLRCGVIFGHGRHFTAGLDLAEVTPLLLEGRAAEMLPPELPDPWGFAGDPCPKPLVVATQGRCNTLGIELILANGLAIAADDTKFAQLEVARGIVPLGGATFRLPRQLGSAGLAHLLTAETFDAQTALAMGLVLDVVPLGTQVDAATDLAHRIAKNSPHAVRTSLANWREAERAAVRAAGDHLRGALPEVLASPDAAEGLAAMLDGRDPHFLDS